MICTSILAPAMNSVRTIIENLNCEPSNTD